MAREFKVNEYITLKLEDGKTVIYVAGRLFQQCKYLFLNIPTDKVSSLDELNSIDDIAEELDDSMEGYNERDFNIPPEVEFWGHCSNLQAWIEYDYDTRLIHSNLAFPLLQRLSELGAPKAKRCFKEEITKRFESGSLTTVRFLIEGNYLDFFEKEEIESLLLNTDFIKNIIKNLKKEKYYIEDFAYTFCNNFSKNVPNLLEKSLLKFIENCGPSELYLFFDYEFTKYIKFESILKVLFNENSKLFDILKKVKKMDNLCLYYAEWSPNSEMDIKNFENKILDIMNKNDIEIFEILFAFKLFDYLDYHSLKEYKEALLIKFKRLYEVIFPNFQIENQSYELTIKLLNFIYKAGDVFILDFFNNLKPKIQKQFTKDLENIQKMRIIDSNGKMQHLLSKKILKLIKK